MPIYNHIVKIDDNISKAYYIDNICLLYPKCNVYVYNNYNSSTLDFDFKRYEYRHSLGV